METKELIYVSGINSGIGTSGPQPGSIAEFFASQGILANAHPISATNLMVVDYSGAARKTLNKLGFTSRYCSLVRLEPAVVLPSNYSKRRDKQFGTIITVGGNPLQYPLTVPWPQDMNSKTFLSSTKNAMRLERVVVVNGNKLSLINGELYALRRHCISSLNNLDLFGTSWGMGFSDRLVTLIKATGLSLLGGRIPRFTGLRGWFKRYPQWKGTIGSGYSPNSSYEKLEVMSNYKYALVIENSLDYMSEKLFDALFAGCIPIYVGPDIQNYGIPRDIVIQAKPNLESILESLDQARGLDFEAFQFQVGEYLSDDATKLKWDRENVYKRILELIIENDA